ncbi:hypothetical protein KKF61_04350, partial [Patescibacteria group bacterium]|nr:hypothetical protein [Patescibacteria group bacterium]
TGVFAVQFKNVKAQTGPKIMNVDVNVTLNDISFRWNTDVSTTGVVKIGTSSGSYIYTLESSTSTSSHYVWTRDVDLEYETVYYYVIEATDLEGNTTTSEEYSITTSSQNLRFDKFEIYDIASDKVYVHSLTNKSAFPGVMIGTTQENLTAPENINGDIYSIGGAQTQKWIVSGLTPNTTYYIQATARRSGTMLGYYEEADSTESDILSFTTTGLAKVNSINPTQGPNGIEVTISGENFGASDFATKLVGIGCSPINYSNCFSADIISWSDSSIVIETNSHSSTGPVYVAKRWNVGTSDFDAFTVQGPEFRVVGSGSAATDTNTGPVGTTVNYLNEGFDCSFSTSIQDEDTIKVNSLFTDGSDTDSYLESVYNLYNDNWGRYPRCTEMQFHLDHSTPLDRLTNWLAEETIDEKYGCKYSTTLSDDNTVRVKSLFTLGSDNDEYLGEVYDAYYDNWGRYPRCTEMQFHLDHATPIKRLTSWLEENVPEATTTTEVDVPLTPSDITGTKIEFEDVGSTVGLKDETQSLSFKDTDEITFTGTTTPNSVVTLEIASEAAMVVTTRSNNEGYWVYTLPGPLETGNHTVKVAVTDTSGEAISESEAVSFKVTSSSSVTSTITDTLEEAGFTTTTWLIIGAAAVVIVILIFVIAKKKPVQPKE